MSLPDPNAAAPATEQPAGVVTSTDEIEKKRIELKSMLTTCFVSSTLQVMKAQEGLESISGIPRNEALEREKREAMATALMTLITDLPQDVVFPSDVENPAVIAGPPAQYEALVVSSGGATSGFISKVTTIS